MSARSQFRRSAHSADMQRTIKLRRLIFRSRQRQYRAGFRWPPLAPEWHAFALKTFNGVLASTRNLTRFLFRRHRRTMRKRAAA